MPDQLPPFPVDDVMLDAIEHALGGRYTINDQDEHVLVGADYSMNDLLQFLSGYDPSPENFASLGGDIQEYVGGVLYGRDDIIRALIAEVRRLRHTTERAVQIGEEIGAHLIGRVQTGHADSRFTGDKIVTMTLWAHDVSRPGEFAMYPAQARVLASALNDSAEVAEQ